MACAFNIILFFFVQAATAQFLEDVNRDTTEAPSRKESSPDTAFLGKIGNLFLDFDEAFSRYTGPKVEAENRAKEQLYDKTQSSRANYFGRIRENYRNLQKRVGSALGIDGDLSLISDFLGINVQNRDGNPLVDVSLPFLPMKLSVNSKQAKNTVEVVSPTSANENSVTVDNIPEQRKLDLENNLQLGNLKIKVGSKSSEEMPSVSIDIKQPNSQARSSRPKVGNENQVQNTQSEYIKEGMQKFNQDLKLSNLFESTLKDAEVFSSRKGNAFAATESSETEDHTKNSGRILGDVLYSESTFDKIMKRVIKDSMWFLDSDLSPSKTFERLNRFTLNILQPSEKSGDDLSTKRLSAQKKQSEHEDKEHQPSFITETLRKRDASQKPLHYEVEDKPNSGKIRLDILPQSGSEFKLQSQHEENILLAFTLEGVPLKLRMPAEVGNPLRFLHEALTAAEVALNVPINSYDDLEPAGKEVLQMGSGNKGMMGQAIFVDLSDPQQLKSLLKTLRKFKSNSH